MFTAQALKNGSNYLSEHLSANDYYADGEQVLGQWVGKGAEVLGLAGQSIGPKDAAFEALRSNRHPETGEKMTAREATNRRAMYDFQCSAPKSVSIMAVTFDDARLVEAHKAAVRAAFSELEKYAARRDNHDSGQPVITGNVIAAEFCHDASRELEAQLHTHLVTMNMTKDASGEWLALENSEMYKAIALAGRAYQADLAQRVQALGYSIREDRNEKGIVQGFEIDGVTVQDCARQSTRRAQIEAGIAKFVAEHGRAPTTKEIHVITTETREKKLKEITTPEVRAAQLTKYSLADRERLQQVRESAISRTNQVSIATEHDAQDMIALAIEHCTERAAVVTRDAVLTWALQESLGAHTLPEMRQALDSCPHAVILTNDASKPYGAQKLTSKENLQRELVSLGLVRAQQGAVEPLGTADQISPALRDNPKSKDQYEAVKKLITSRDGVTALIGRAGTGKTHTIKELAAIAAAKTSMFHELVRVAENAGVELEFCSPSHKGKQKLQDDKFNADTVSMLLIQLQKKTKDLRGKLLVVDEAGMLSTQQGAEILYQAQKAGARVLLVGDDKQLLSVESGDWLGMLLKRKAITNAELTYIWRQQTEDYRGVTTLLGEGKIRTAFVEAKRLGMVHSCGNQYLDAAATKYLEHRNANTSVVMVSPTWAEIDLLNARVRDALDKAGELRGGEMKKQVMDTADLSAAQRRVVGNYRPGEFVRATQRVSGQVSTETWAKIKSADKQTGVITLEGGGTINVRKHGKKLEIARQIEIGIREGDTLMCLDNAKKVGVTNGDLAVVTAIDTSGTIQVRTKAGVTLALPATYTGVVHAYAVTVHKSQGDTETATIPVGARWDERAANVAITRARKMCDIYVPDAETVRASLTDRISGKEHAMDYYQPMPATPETAANVAPGAIAPAPTEPAEKAPEQAQTAAPEPITAPIAATPTKTPQKVTNKGAARVMPPIKSPARLVQWVQVLRGVYDRAARAISQVPKLGRQLPPMPGLPVIKPAKVKGISR